jgi:hypothetical protein
VAYVLVPVAAGTGPQLASPAVRQRLARQEATLPEQTPVELALAFDLRLPVVGRVDLAKPVGQAVNAAYRAGQFVIRGETMPLWEGATVPATWDSERQTTVIRWRKGQPFDPLVVAVVLGVVVAGFLVWQYLTHWQFSRAVVGAAGKVASGAADLGRVAFAGGAVVAGLWLLDQLRHRR